MPEPDPVREAQRQLTVCNACRYCEGFCAVFSAMELRRTFTDGNIAYLANLCHDCRACYYACMYTPPHEFEVNIPSLLSEARVRSYRGYTVPAAAGRLFGSVPAAAAVGAAAIVIIAALVLLLAGPGRLVTPHRGPGAFYAVIPYLAMLVPGLAAFGYWIGVWTAGGMRFWRDAAEGASRAPAARSFLRAVWAMLVLRYLQGGGPGCPYPDEKPSGVRRTLHMLVYYGFMSAVASTTLAAVEQELLHRLPPYPLTSAPVLLGLLGGIAMLIGIIGLLVLKAAGDRRAAAAIAEGQDYVFLFTLALVSVTGILTLLLRETAAMGVVLTVHLGVVAALFVTAPYGKFVHALYRFLALVRYQFEQMEA